REQLRGELSLVPTFSVDDEPHSIVSLTFHLITLGDRLTPATESAIQILKNRLNDLERKHPGLSLSFEHIGISELSNFFENPDSTLKRPGYIKLRLAYDKLKFKTPQEAEIGSQNFVTFYTPASDLVTAARMEGVSLFDANVRYELSSSNI